MTRLTIVVLTIVVAGAGEVNAQEDDSCYCQPMYRSKDGTLKPLWTYDEALVRADEADLAEEELKRVQTEFDQAEEALGASRTQCEKLETDLAASTDQLATSRKQTAEEREKAAAAVDAVAVARDEQAKTLAELNDRKQAFDEQAERLAAAEKEAAKRCKQAEENAEAIVAAREAHGKTKKELECLAKYHQETKKELECLRKNCQEMAQRLVAVRELSGDLGPWSFWRGFNVNGPAIEIDGNQWDGEGAPPQLLCNDRKVNRPRGPLHPPVDATRGEMIRSFRWDRHAKLSVVNVPPGKYAVYAYVWEETDPTTFSVRLNKSIVERDYNSGPRGNWRRLGPWVANPNDGKITITADGGDANFSGIELWRHTTTETRGSAK